MSSTSGPTVKVRNRKSLNDRSRSENGSKFECEEPNCDNPARIEVWKQKKCLSFDLEVTKKSSKGTGKNKKTTSKKVRTKDVKWSEGQQ